MISSGDLNSADRNGRPSNAGIWPFNAIGRQWQRVRAERGGRKLFGLILVGAEVLVIALVIAAIVFI